MSMYVNKCGKDFALRRRHAQNATEFVGENTVSCAELQPMQVCVLINLISPVWRPEQPTYQEHVETVHGPKMTFVTFAGLLL